MAKKAVKKTFKKKPLKKRIVIHKIRLKPAECLRIIPHPKVNPVLIQRDGFVEVAAIPKEVEPQTWLNWFFGIPGTDKTPA